MRSPVNQRILKGVKRERKDWKEPGGSPLEDQLAGDSWWKNWLSGCIWWLIPVIAGNVVLVLY